MNPWCVGSLEAFVFICCPQCDYRSKEEKDFHEHATENHPDSKAFFDIIIAKAQSIPLATTTTTTHFLEPLLEEPPSKVKKELIKLETEPMEHDFSEDFVEPEVDIKQEVVEGEMKHEATAHAKKNSCQFCGKSFDKPSKLKRHVAAVHGLILAHCKIQILYQFCSSKK